MVKIRITKSFTFEMAHALWNYDGPCKNIHGHSYKLFVTVIGQVSDDTDSTKLGMVIDFSDLKKLVETHIIDVYDHSVVISTRASSLDIQRVEQMFEKFYIVDFQPTSENLVADMAKKISTVLPANTQLFSLKLIETETSFAEWFAVDNPM
jgi:6-pyruvoyltetrahydropterin/6-carboxytetrahydropterin synthase